MHTDAGSVLFIPHGGGPLPLLGDETHLKLNNFLKTIKQSLIKPSAILVISAHWEASLPTITSGASPALIYDYSGFPDESYDIEYPAAGSPALAKNIYELLLKSGIKSKLDDKRGFDHGLFVPLKIMFPDASIPCVQLSLCQSLDPDTHINIGKALAELAHKDILILGSGFTFHNLRAMFSPTASLPDEKNEAFEQWLIDTCTNKDISAEEREQALISWEQAPFARYCHPREEHLLPLHICSAITGTPGKLVFNDKVLRKKTCAFLW